MKTFICFVLLSIFVSYANEQEEAVEHNNNTRVSVYLHPFSLLYDITAIYYSTVEIPFSLSNSLIIKPSLLNGDTEFRLGSDIGFRHYLTRKGEGLYLQGQMGIFYYRRNANTRDCDCDLNSDVFCCESDTFTIPGDYLFPVFIAGKSLWLDVMCYIGHSLKFSRMSVFIDVGFGGALGIGTETGRVNLFGLPDLNIGIGIPFGAPKPINTQEVAQKELEPKQDNTMVSIYFHPLFFLLGYSEEANQAFLIYSTIEIPFNLEWALIIKPSLVNGAKEVRQYDERYRQLRVGGDIGIRAYEDRKGEGFYWQMQTGVFYYDAFRLFPEISARNSIWVDIMGYSGYSWKFSRMSLFADIGIGLGGIYGKWYAFGCDDKCFGFFPIVDANFGIGIPLF